MSAWTTPELIDLEFFLSQDGVSPDAAITARDRQIFLEEIEPQVEHRPTAGAAYRRSVLKLWLASRTRILLRETPQAILPGRIFLEAKALLRLAVAVIGLCLGASLALSLLIYTGARAVNVTLYLGVLVFLQVLTLLIMARFLFFKTSLGTLKQHSLLYVSLSRALERIAARLARGAASDMPGRERDGLQAFSGLFQGMYGIYGKALFWPFFGMVQLFGIMFNVGAIGATLIRVLTSDLAFGWQSTVQLSSEAVFTLVKGMAVPWSWIFGPYAYPSLAQIEGSRMVLKEGLRTLATGNLVAWWPFLIGAVVCYGLLPRVCLTLLARWGEKRELARLRFSHAACEELILRMRSPAVSTRGIPDIPSPAPRPEAASESPEAAFLALMDATALIPEDILELAQGEELADYLASRLGLKLTQSLAVSGSIARDREALSQAGQRPAGEERAVVLVQEAWQPPIAETLDFIRALRASAPKDMPLAVLLIGRPGADRLLTPVLRLDKAIWHKALTALADPYLSLITAGET